MKEGNSKDKVMPGSKKLFVAGTIFVVGFLTPLLIPFVTSSSLSTGWKDSQMYLRWMADQMWTFVPAQAITAEFLQTFKEFPPVSGSSLGVGEVLKSLQTKPQN